MGSILLRLFFLASFTTVLNAQASETDPAYAVLIQRFFNSLPVMIQSQVEGNPEKFNQILAHVMGDGLLGKLLSDPIQGVAKGLNIDDPKGDHEENGVQKLWSSISSNLTKQVGNITIAPSPTTPATAATVSITVPPPSQQSLTTGQGQIDEKKLAEAFLVALKKSIGPSTTPLPADYIAQFLQPRRIDYSTDGSQDYQLSGRNPEPFRRAPPSQRYQYLMKEYQNMPIEEQVLDEVNQESILAYAQGLRNKQMAFLANNPLPQQSWQQRLPATQTLPADELIRMHELLKMYEAKIGQPHVASGSTRGRLSSRVRSTEYEDDDQQKPQLEELINPSSAIEPTRRRQSHIFPDMVTSESTASPLASSTTADTKSVSSDETETLASAFNVLEQQLTEIDNQCGCVPLDLNLMEGHWVQALGHTENVKRIYKGALHLMQESNKVDLKPTCARFKFEQPIGHPRIGQEANMTWTFKTSETGKPYTLQGTVVTTDHRTVQLQLEGPGSYKFNLPVCAQKTGTSADGSKYNFVVLAETVGADKCRSAHVLVRNPAAFFHERNEELIGFLKSRIENDVMKPVSVVPFGTSCD